MSDHLIKVAFVEDDSLELTAVERALKRPAEGYYFDLSVYENPHEFVSALDNGLEFDVAILDVHFTEYPEITGIQLIKEIRDRSQDKLILMRTNDIGSVRNCRKAGANDFIYKQGKEVELAFRVVLAFKAHKEDMVQSSDLQYKVNVIGDTMQGIAKRVPKIIGSAVNAVHVTGESGTGKEVVSALFESNLGRTTPFEKVNCAAIAGGTMLSELFGHAKGSFTGASSDKRGLVEAADRGWLYLDEVAELTPEAQGALLRVLETGEFNRVGETKTRKVKLKLLSATNEDIPKLIQEGKFRQDLWQRLCEAEICLAPLRERQNEISLLAEHFASTADGGPYKITIPTMKILNDFSWSEGNVRQLRNCIRAMTEHAIDGLLSPMSIPERVWNEIGNDDTNDQVNDDKSVADSSDEKRLTISWRGDIPPFRDLHDRLVLEYVKFVHKYRGRTSLRKLVSISGMARSTITPRLKKCVENGWITPSEIKNLVDIEV